jgi:hypothetical protein
MMALERNEVFERVGPMMDDGVRHKRCQTTTSKNELGQRVIGEKQSTIDQSAVIKPYSSATQKLWKNMRELVYFFGAFAKLDA